MDIVLTACAVGVVASLMSAIVGLGRLASSIGAGPRPRPRISREVFLLVNLAVLCVLGGMKTTGSGHVRWLVRPKGKAVLAFAV